MTPETLEKKTEQKDLGVVVQMAATDPEMRAFLDPKQRLEWSFSGYEYNRLFTRTGERFYFSHHTSGLGTNVDGRSGVAADFDHDGDPDLILHNFQGHFGHPRHRDVQIYENTLGDGKDFLEIQLRSAPPNTRAVGARVVATCGGKGQVRQVTAGHGFGSQSPYRLFFGFRGCDKSVKLDVFWPDGQKESFVDIEPGQRLVLYQGKQLPKKLAMGAAGSGAVGQDLVQTIKGERWSTLTGGTKSLPNASRKTILSFWAPWCRPCTEEIPQLLDWSKKNKKTHQLFLALPSGELDETAKQYAAKTGIQRHVVVGGDRILQAITGGEYSLPTTLILNDNMELERTFIGNKIAYDEL